MTPQRSGSLSLPGAALAWESQGDGPPVVLVHGFALDSRMWDDLVPELAADHTVLRYDCRGFGRSGDMDPGIPYTHAEDLVALLDHHHLEKVALVGLSFGGRVALRTALLAPDRVVALVLVDAVLDGVPWDEDSTRANDAVARAVSSEGVGAGRRAWLAHPLFAEASRDRDLAARLAAMVDNYPGQHWLGDDPHRQEEPALIDALSQVSARTTVIVGDRDVPGFLHMADVLARDIPGAQLVRIPGAGHMTPMEAPSATYEALREALSANA